MIGFVSEARPLRRAWLVWGAGLAAYVVAVLQRTSLGVAGLDAARRFDVSASVLATFAVVQLLVYAGLQIPVGVSVDRLGPRRLIATGAVVMAAGQVMLAVTHSFGPAILARVLVGAGDAMTFVSLLRLVNTWFPARRVPVMTQLAGMVGQVGQLLSAVPLVSLLHHRGWTTAFLSVGSLGVVMAFVAVVGIRDSPAGASRPVAAIGARQVLLQLRAAWLHPGTRLGLWTHFSTQFSGTVFALLWGFPFLVSGEGMSSQAAGELMSLLVFTSLLAGPVFGRFVALHPLRRSWLVLTIIGATVAVWTLVLAWPGRAPLWLLVVLVLVLAVGGPGSMVGFDFARSFNPPARLGTATGIVNIGGFVAALLTMLALGVVIDLVAPGSGGAARSYPLSAFRAGWSVQYVVWAVGVGGILRTRWLARRRMAAAGVVVPPIRDVIARERAARQARRRR
jgi:sugar phosphate permease